MNVTHSQPDETIEYPHRLAWPFVGAVTAVIGLVGMTVDSWLAWLVALGGILVVAEFLWQRRTPALILSASKLVYRPSLLARSREVDFSTVGAWAHSPALLVFATSNEGTVEIPLAPLEPERRRELIQRLEAIHLQSVPLKESLTQGYRGGRARVVARNLGLFLLVLAVLLVVVVLLRGTS